MRGNAKRQIQRLLHWLRTEGKRFCAALLCASLIAGNMGNLSALAGGRADDEFYLDRASLYDALQKAVAEGGGTDGRLSFSGDEADVYEEYLEEDGNLYELKPEMKHRGNSVQLRIFARLEGEIALEDTYEVTGSEEIVFLLANSSNKGRYAVIRVDGRETEPIWVPSKNLEDGEETWTDTATSSDAALRFDPASPSDVEFSWETATSSDATSSNATVSDAARDSLDGEVLPAVFLNEKMPAVAFVTNLDSVGINPETVPGREVRLEFVCGVEEHIMNDVLNAYRETMVSLGQSVPADMIPDAETVDAEYRGVEACQHGPEHQELLLKWQLKSALTGEMVDLNENTILTADYLDAEDRDCIRAYAVWEKKPAELYTMVFHDILPDGTEAAEPVRLDVAADVTIGAAAEQAKEALADGKQLSECVWYGMDENGTRNPVDLDVMPEADMEFFTYTYRLSFSGNPAGAKSAGNAEGAKSAEKRFRARALMQADGNAEEGNAAAVITGREGEPLSQSEFVIDGVDYSLYPWTYTDADGNSQELALAELMEAGLTENVEAVSAANPKGYPTGTGTVHFYVLVNGAWMLAQEPAQEVTAYIINNRYYLSADDLERVYGKFGFKKSDLTVDTRLFPHTIHKDATMWADCAPIVADGVVYSPILETKNGVSCDVYYLPGDLLNKNKEGSKLVEKVKESQTDTFYTITVMDPDEKVYTADEVPEVSYVLYGNPAEVTVKRTGKDEKLAGWMCSEVDPNNLLIEEDETKDTIKFTIRSVTQTYRIMPGLKEGERAVYYEIVNLPQKPSDPEYTTPQIHGASKYTETTTNDYTVLAPSPAVYFYKIGKRLGTATFTGWMVNGNPDQVIQSGEKLDFEKYGSIVTLTDTWRTEAADTENEIINFYVSIRATTEGSDAWSGDIDETKFTEAVYSSNGGVAGLTAVNQELYTSKYQMNPNSDPDYYQYFILGGTNTGNLNENHIRITEELTNGYVRKGMKDGMPYTFQSSFPTDEEVLRAVRRMVNDGEKITINGKTILAEDVTAENFTVRWYVFKYDSKDGWHIDGVLVAKKGKLVVKKTFAGDSEAIEKVKAKYSITVAAEGNKEIPVNAGAELTLSKGSYDKATDTYTWEVDVDQYYNYNLTEKNYLSDESLETTTAQYYVKNSRVKDQNSDSWKDYNPDQGVVVTGRGYNEQDLERLTVAFVNTYTAPGTLILKKIDAVTGNRMPGVEFTIEKADKEDFVVYDMGNSHYTADSRQASGKTGTNKIVTDHSGQAYLWIGGGDYIFVEKVPTGYDDPRKITVRLKGDETEDYKIIGIESAEAENTEKAFVEKRDDNHLELIVKNYSRSISLTVKKIWADQENKPVTIQLYRGGDPLGSEYTVELKGTESPAWEHTFQDLPLYADGGLAAYTIREEAVGEFKYSEEYGDGYLYYDVTYSGLSYLDKNGEKTSDMNTAAGAVLTATNKRSQAGLSINKVDGDGNPLEGAIFDLYAKESVTIGDNDVPLSAGPSLGADGLILEGQKPIQTAISSASGLVSFGTLNTGIYYLVERSAPTGYEGSRSLYRIVFEGDGDKTKLYRWSDSAWNLCDGKQVVNPMKTVDVSIQKLVAGIMGDRSRKFQFQVTVKQPGSDKSTSVPSFSLGHGEIETLKGIQAGSVLTITETGADDYTMTIEQSTNFEVAQPEGQTHTWQVTISADATEPVEIIVKNQKDGDVDTGVILDSLPYILLLGAAVAGIAIYLIRRRKKDEDDLD